jgi:hypothetical protein
MEMSGQGHAPAALPRERPGTHCKGVWVAPRAVLDGCGTSWPHRDSIPLNVQPAESRYTDWAIPAHLLWKDKLLFIYLYLFICLFILSGSAAQRGLWPPRSRGFVITHNDAPQSVGLLWTSNQFVAETSTWQHATHSTDKHPCHRWDSNPRSQQASGIRPAPYTALPQIQFLNLSLEAIIF